MPDIRMTVLDWQRVRAHGLSQQADRWRAVVDKDDVLGLTIDWTRYLDGETISSTSYTASGVRVGSEAEASGITTASLSGIGEGDVQTTTSGGRKMTLRLATREAMDASADRYAA